MAQVYLTKPDDFRDQVSKGNGIHQRRPTFRMNDYIDIKLAESGGGTTLPEKARSSLECEVNVISDIFAGVGVGIGILG